MISRKFRLFPCARPFWRASILAVALAWSIFAPAANAQTPKANELVKITSARIDQPLRAGGASTLKVAALVIPGWHVNSDKPSRDHQGRHLQRACAACAKGRIDSGRRDLYELICLRRLRVRCWREN